MHLNENVLLLKNKLIGEKSLIIKKYLVTRVVITCQ
jgi:hypothetical protein